MSLLQLLGNIVPPSIGTPIGNLPISPSVSSIFNEMSQNGQATLFQNPVIGNINRLDLGITNLVDVINNSTCLNYSSANKQSVITSLTGVGGLREQLVAFTTHTDTLAGVIAGSANNPTPGLEKILSVGRSINDIANTIEQASGCIGYLGGMLGLFSEETLEEHTSKLKELLEQVNGCLADLVAVVDQINEIKDSLAAIISADQDFYNQSLELLRQFALSSLLDYMYNNPCGRFILENRIAQKKLLSKFT